MIKEALEYLIGLRRPDVVDVNDRKYATGDLYPIGEPVQEALRIGTLTALADYIRLDADRLTAGKHVDYIIHIVSPTEVNLLLPPTEPFKKRPVLLKCVPELPKLHIGEYLPPEQMVIMLQSGFARRTGDYDKVIAAAGNVTESAARSYSDDGMSQAITMRSGVATKADVVVPNPVYLAPYRTFAEIEQPASAFVFRARGGGEKEKPTFALIEADGGAWRIEAMQQISEWLSRELNCSRATEGEGLCTELHDYTVRIIR